MKIKKEQIRNLDVDTLVNAIHWLYDSNWRMGQCDKIAKATKTNQIRNAAAADARNHCLAMLEQLARFAAGRAEMADEVNIITCPTCDVCGWPAVHNYGDEYTTVCCCCRQKWMTGNAAAEYINKHE